MTRKTVTCIGVRSKPKEWIGDEFEDRQFTFLFSIKEPSIPGNPREQIAVEVNITGELLFNWQLTHTRDEELAKILLYYAAKYVRQKMLEGMLEKRESITMWMKDHREPRCPVEVLDIKEVEGFSFDVDTSGSSAISVPKAPLSTSEVATLTLGGETQTVEFKQAVCRNPYTGKKDTTMHRNVIEAVAAFMNAGGGTLLIGVADDGTVTGVNVEYPVANPGNPTWDGYALYLADLLNNNLQVETPFLHYTLTRHLLEGRDVCCVTVRPASAPVYVDKHLFVRTGAQSRELHGPDLVTYIQQRWQS